MFDSSSRYYSLETAIATTSDGRSVAYKRCRFLPQPNTLPLLVEVTVAEGDRLDLITHQTLGDAEQFWRVCDANPAMNPFDLTATPGQVVKVPIPQF